MIYRALAAVIVVFWIVMTVLLVRVETEATASKILAIPPEHVWKVMFRHGQPSDLVIFRGRERAGTLFLQPRSDPRTGKPQLNLGGSFWVKTAPKEQRRFLWDGICKLNDALEVTSVVLSVKTEPNFSLTLTWNSEERAVTYRIAGEAGIIQEGRIDPKAGATDPRLAAAGIDFHQIQSLAGSAAAPTLIAKQGSLLVRGEKVDAFLLSLHQGETPLAQIYVSQIGQILKADTVLGYSLAADDLTP